MYPQRCRTETGCCTTIKEREKKQTSLLDKNLSKLLSCTDLEQRMHVCGYAKMCVGQNIRSGSGVQTGLDVESRDVTKAGSA